MSAASTAGEEGSCASPPSWMLPLHEAAYVPGVGLLVFGGIGGQGMSEAERVKLADLWIFDGTSLREWRR